MSASERKEMPQLGTPSSSSAEERVDMPSSEFARVTKQIQAEAGRYLAWLNSSKPLNDEFRMIKGRIVTLACQMRSLDSRVPTGGEPEQEKAFSAELAAAQTIPDVAETEAASGDTEDDMQFAFRMVREFLDGLDREIKAQPSSELARGVALGVTFGVREYVSRMATIAAEKKQEHAR